MDWLDSLVERRIREATERGEFDDLPGTGRPLDLRDAGDPDWWIKRLARREQIDPSSLVPPTLALRREAEGFPESLADLTREDQVRAVLEDFNERVRADWRGPKAGPSLPLPAQEVDVDAVVAAWREHARPPQAASGPPVAPALPEKHRRPWWARLLRPGRDAGHPAARVPH